MARGGDKIRPSQTTFFQSCLGVFQGGGCRAAAFAGAVEEASSRGTHFVELAGTSAGSIVAALLGAGANSSTLRTIVEDLDYSTLLKPASGAKPRWHSFDYLASLYLRAPIVLRRLPRLDRFLLYRGIYSSSRLEEWLEHHLGTLLPHQRKPIRFGDLHFPTWVVAADLVTKSVKVWSTHNTPDDEVARAVRASCSIPVFFQPVDGRYVDGGILSNLPSFVFSTGNSISNRILAFTLESDARKGSTSNSENFANALLDTVIEGARDLQLRIQDEVHVVSIPTGTIRATDFENMDDTSVQELVESGRTAAARFFDNELAKVKPTKPPQDVCAGKEEMFAAVVGHLGHKVDEIYISESDTEWVYSLFPSLFVWRRRGVSIHVALPTTVVSDHDRYRRALLRLLGIVVREVPDIPPKCFLFDPADEQKCSAVVGVPRSTHSVSAEAIIYSAGYDIVAIQGVAEKVRASFDGGPSDLQVPRLEPGMAEELLKRLRRSVKQYSRSDVSCEFETVPINRLMCLTKYARAYKYRQIASLIGLYDDAGVQRFDPAYVLMADRTRSIITPPVVEEIDDSYVLIEGTTRAVYCRDQGIDAIRCVVVKGVSDPLPSPQLHDISLVRVVEKTLTLPERYGALNRDHFRHIEKAVRPPGDKP